MTSGISRKTREVSEVREKSTTGELSGNRWDCLDGDLLELVGGPHLDVAVRLRLVQFDDVRRRQHEQLKEEGSGSSSRGLQKRGMHSQQRPIRALGSDKVLKRKEMLTLLATFSNSTGLVLSSPTCSCRTRTALRVFLLCRLMLPLFCVTTLSAPAIAASCSVPSD